MLCYFQSNANIQKVHVQQMNDKRLQRQRVPVTVIFYCKYACAHHNKVLRSFRFTQI